MTPVVVDTNVVVAGLLTANADSPVAHILDDMLTAAFPFVVSTILLAEYRAVLNRPALRKLHGLDKSEIETIVATLAEHAAVLDSVPAPAAPDPGDQHLWELLSAREDLCLVTGDKLLLKHHAEPFQIISPAAFAAQEAGTLTRDESHER